MHDLDVMKLRQKRLDLLLYFYEIYVHFWLRD